MLKHLESLLNRWKKESDQSKEKEKLIKTITGIQAEITEYEQQINCSDEPGLKSIFQEEIDSLHQKTEILIQNFKTDRLSKVENVILEIRSGEGGEEAALFALELLEMYKKACKKQNWDFKLFNVSLRECGGLKECSGEITGKGVNLLLAQESGVHCVKRVPKTEKKGRTHTSTATVAILKQPNEIEVVLEEKDLKIDVFRSSGPGGQSVNTTDSAVRITHIPTGVVVSQQDEKSQLKNKEKALKILKARIYAKKLEEETEKHVLERRDAIGKAKRNERVRTYHFTQNWVNDSRISLKSHNVNKFMEAEDLLLFLNELVLDII